MILMKYIFLNHIKPFLLYLCVKIIFQFRFFLANPDRRGPWVIMLQYRDFYFKASLVKIVRGCSQIISAAKGGGGTAEWFLINLPLTISKEIIELQKI